MARSLPELPNLALVLTEIFRRAFGAPAAAAQREIRQTIESAQRARGARHACVLSNPKRPALPEVAPALFELVTRPTAERVHAARARLRRPASANVGATPANIGASRSSPGGILGGSAANSDGSGDVLS